MSSEVFIHCIIDMTEEHTLPTTTRAGFHSYVVSGTKFEVDLKYKPINPIGHGAYGVVMYVNYICTMLIK